jgi:CRP/FNR family transcriptional regulator, anaerobic regulatory protein
MIISVYEMWLSIFTSMTVKELARHFPTFEKKLLSEVLEAAEIKTISEDEVIVRSGQNIRAAILVVDGLVKIYREDEDGNEYFMYYLDEGKACAVSLVCASGKGTSSVRAKAVNESTIMIVPAEYVDDWIGRYKSWAQFAVNSYRERFEELLQIVDQIAFKNMDERLVFYLKRHQGQLNTNLIYTSFTEIAQELNSSREVISRLMKKLSEKGAVYLHGTHVRIIDLGKAIN